MLPICLCDTFLQVWPIFLYVNLFLTHLFNMTHFSKCDPFIYVWPMFASVTHFSMCDPFLHVWPILPSVTHSLRVTYFLSDAHFFKSDPFSFTRDPCVTHLFLNVTYLCKCDPLLQVWPIFLACVTHFSIRVTLFLTHLFNTTHFASVIHSWQH